MNDSAFFHEQGFVLVVTMMLLVVLTLISLTAIRSSRIELQVSGNEKWEIDSFYRSESGGEIATRVIEDSVSGRRGGGAGSSYFGHGNSSELLIPDLDFDLKNWSAAPVIWEDNSGNLLNTAIFYPRSNVKMVSSSYRMKRPPLTQIQIRKTSVKPIGGSMESGRAAGGYYSSSQACFDIWSRNVGLSNSENIIYIRWLHID